MGFVSAAAAISAAALVALLPSQVAADKPYHVDLESYQDGAFGDVPTQTFHSSSIKAPIYQVNHWDPEKIDTENPYMFMAGRYGKYGPSIVSSKDLSLIWADQNYNGLAQTARTWDNFKGKRVMTAFADGRVRVYDESYKQLYILTAKGDLDGLSPDSHEAMLTEDGNVLLFVCPPREVDLSKVGGPEKGKKIADCTIQEINPDTEEVVFQWATSSYFKPEDSVWKYKDEDVWDYCHMNAVEKTPEGNYIVSFRHLSCVIMIDGKTKEVIWTMWGKKNMFEDISQKGSAKFAYQHEARITGQNRFTLFDNHDTADNGFCEGDGCSRGLEVEYDLANKTVWMVNEWYHPQGLLSASRGGVQRTSSGNVIIAWGQNPMYTEYTPEGDLAMDVQRAPVKHIEHGIFDVITYRIWKGNWVGKPSGNPNISCNPDDTGRSIYVSWNGATEVAHWVMLMADNYTELNGADKVMAQSPRNGFETQFKLDKILSYARVAALDADGRIIGSTPGINTRTGKHVDLEYKITDVTLAESNSIDSAVPSSASVSVPTGSSYSDDNDDDDDDSTAARIAAHYPIIGSILGFIICAAAAVGLIFCLRRRKMNRSQGRSDEAGVYGRLTPDANGHYEDSDSRDSNNYRESKESLVDRSS